MRCMERQMEIDPMRSFELEQKEDLKKRVKELQAENAALKALAKQLAETLDTLRTETVEGRSGFFSALIDTDEVLMLYEEVCGDKQ